MSRMALWALLALLVAFPAKTGGAQEPVPAGEVPEQAEAEDTADDPVAVDPVAEAYRVFGEGRFAQMSGEREEAIAAYRRAAELDPRAVDPLIEIANISLSTRDLEAAEAAAAAAVERDPDAAAAHRALGAVHFRRLRSGDDPEAAERAVASLSEAVRLDPEDLRSRSQLARLLAALQRGEEAATHLREILRHAPDAFSELLLLAQLRLSAGDREQAFDYLLQSLRIEPRQPEAREMVDDLLRDRGIPGRSPDEALAEVVALYEKGSADHPDDQALRLSLADGLARLGRLEAAAEAFERILAAEPRSEIALMGLAMVRRQQRQLEDAEAALLRLLEENSRSVPARMALGGVFATRCEYARAAEEFQAVVALPRDSYGLRHRRETLARLAQALEHLGEYKEAYDALQEAFRLAGDSVEAFRYRVALVQNRVAAGQPDEAAALIEALIADRPGEPGLLALQARVLNAGGRSDAALGILRALVAEYPETGGAVHALVRHHVERGELPVAERITRDWLEARANDPDFRFQLGALLERQGRFEEAEAEFRRVIAAKPDHDLALNYLGYMLADGTDRLEESEQLIQRALAEDPYNGSYLDSLGWVQFRQGDLSLAEPNLLRAQQCMPENSVVLDHLGDLYRAKGNSEEAVRFWRKALQHDGDEELEREAIARKIEEAGNDRD
ncbi:MAG: tetratricopeptide repeat protein [Acidobacteria bacterium]|nr:tetratricopeptide repeat protein [Acidobacteriota bacterium]MXW72449.1 tetratricopeptide repeat protein [Acidobacteriota bacterium]MXX87364.1 tetratricopeptide repeat protein [Acidobacteriota bacterium]MYE43414.1 tetratricopeptide repeat protein [Acidobacteriota bacterium]MYF76014.1 tetratricopeptide repeat protein [Acidobacteriota bacterium]